MKKLVPFVLVVAVLVAGASVLAACGDELPTGAVASVGGRVVTKAQFDSLMGQYKAQYDAQAGQPGATAFPEEGTPEYKALAAEVVKALVISEIVRREADERHLVVSDDELNEAVAQTEAAQGGREALAGLLQQYGMTEDDLRVVLTTSLLEGKVGPAVTADVAPSEQEIREYFEANRSQFDQAESRQTRHILVDDAATAEKVAAALSADPGDANWKKLAKQYSIDDSNKDNGGNLGPVVRGQMVPAFDEAVFGADEGEVVGPVKTKFGWHVLQVTEITPAVAAEYEKVREQIAQQLGGQSAQEAWQRWLEESLQEAVYAPGFDPDELAPAPTTEETIQP